MPVGKSGRIVIEIDPVLKQELYKSLGSENSNLRSWFLDNVDKYLAEKSETSMNFKVLETDNNKETVT
jgi:hypothetical protein